MIVALFCFSPASAEERYEVNLNQEEALKCIESKPWEMVRDKDFTIKDHVLRAQDHKIDDLHAAIMGCIAVKQAKQPKTAAAPTPGSKSETVKQ
jgi:hypothetical protein